MARKPSASMLVKRDADDAAPGDKAGLDEMEKPGQQLASGEIACRTEEHDDLRIAGSDPSEILLHSVRSTFCCCPALHLRDGLP